ncbi:hypothetical protein VTL71DRAFT_11113 [Oculimacula yallundae]|uniref:Uncharacterized protein n=1 Tax=Oculimacula yallundae TaxID=86028 RepID=A0ABR4CW34_9HELO
MDAKPPSLQSHDPQSSFQQTLRAMARRHATLNARALATLLDPSTGESKIVDGFGDFCFIPASAHCTDCGILTGQFHASQYLRKIMRKNVLSQQSRWSSDSTFPILELPVLVRDLIYNFLMEPFRNPWGDDYIRVSIGFVQKRRCHPFRNGYSMYIPWSVGKVTDGWLLPYDKHRHLMMEDFDTIRALSQVNHQLRAELGAAFWRNIYVDIDHWEYLFLDFLDDRPSVRNGIKKLRMEWKSGDSAYWLDDKITVFCEYVSQHLELEELVFAFSTTVPIIKYLLTHDDVKWVKAFRKMKFKNLRISLCMEPEEDFMYDPEIELDFAAGNVEAMNDLQVGEGFGTELEGEHSEASGDEASDAGAPDQSPIMDIEDTYEAARASVIKTYTPLLEALLRPAAPASEISKEQQYLSERASMVAPPNPKVEVPQWKIIED